MPHANGAAWLTTSTLCSIPDVTSALNEVRRALKPSGKLLFVEHGRAPDAPARRCQDRLTPIWKRLAGGCHLNRPIDLLITRAGFLVEPNDHRLHARARMMTCMYEGRARPK
jgi:hypothetical protein